MKKETLTGIVLGLCFLAGSIMALDGIINYFGWNLPTYSTIGIGLMIGSFTPKFFGSN